MTHFGTITHSIYFEQNDIFEKKNDILYPLQFGFRKHHCTYMSIAYVYEKITANLQKGEITRVHHLDLKKPPILFA